MTKVKASTKNKMFQEFLEKWLEFVHDPNTSKLSEILAEDVVFFSPVVYSPQKGKTLTTMYLMGASEVLSNGFKYQKKIINGLHGVLEFSCIIDDLIIEGVDIIELNEDGKIINFKVMVRPIKAVNKVHQKMGELIMKMNSKK